MTRNIGVESIITTYLGNANYIKIRNKRKTNEYLLYEYLFFGFEQLSLINYHN